MTRPGSSTLLVAAYSFFLLAVAYGFDLMAKHVARRSQRWRNGAFTYHADHDAWLCPEDQWLWPTSFDPKNRTMRYRGSPLVCNSCPVKDTCTTSAFGREITREIDPWPYSEAGRFHRGIACCIGLLGLVLPLGMLFGVRSATEALVMVGSAFVAAAALVPLARHLWRSPSGFPEHVRQQVGPVVDVEAAVDRYSTRWGFAARQSTTREQERSA